MKDYVVVPKVAQPKSFRVSRKDCLTTAFAFTLLERQDAIEEAKSVGILRPALRDALERTGGTMILDYGVRTEFGGFTDFFLIRIDPSSLGEIEKLPCVGSIQASEAEATVTKTMDYKAAEPHR